VGIANDRRVAEEKIGGRNMVELFQPNALQLWIALREQSNKLALLIANRKPPN